ncbi:RBBP9/YdeN family alpha/beta hydrolase [Pseudomonas asplenii]|uniref:RBBP9/YdeN family alpha/beta hydrolase n=1 Tax=Pseudomonas asplenii TaxID=53407 RepID=UPI0037C8C175
MMFQFWKAALAMAALWALAQPASATPDAEKPIVYILHGYAASPEDHWFSWLRDSLAKKGIDAQILEFPTPNTPSYPEWSRYLSRVVKRHDKRTYFVAHSLGCITLLRYLQAQDENTRIGGMVLVSGFASKLPEFHQLDTFIADDVSFRQIVTKVAIREVIAAKDDPIVPYPLTRELAHNLDASLHTMATGGHFLASDGFSEFPLVLRELTMMINTEPGP